MANKKERTHGGNEKEKKKKKRKEEQQTNKQTNKKKEQKTFLKERGGKKCQREAGQRLNTRNPCTRYNPLSRQQHGRAKDAHEPRHNERSR